MRPDLVICESTEADVGWDERRLRYVLARGQGFDSPLYREVLDSAGVEPGWSPDQYKHALQPYHREILAGVYRAMAADGRRTGVPIVWVLIPRVGRPTEPAAARRHARDGARRGLRAGRRRVRRLRRAGPGPAGRRARRLPPQRRRARPAGPPARRGPRRPARAAAALDRSEAGHGPPEPGPPPAEPARSRRPAPTASPSRGVPHR